MKQRNGREKIKFVKSAEKKNTHANCDVSEVLGLEELERSLYGPTRAKHRNGNVVRRLAREAQAEATAL